MELKDKLDLLWKYLLLLVVVVGMCSHLCHRGYGKYGCGKYSKGCWHQQQKNDFQSEVKDIQIKMEVNGEDTLLKVIVNGKELSPNDAKTFLKDNDEKELMGIKKFW